MVRVKVQRISSVSDPETGKPGKQIELVEVRNRKENNVKGMMGGSEEGVMIKDKDFKNHLFAYNIRHGRKAKITEDRKCDCKNALKDAVY